MTTNAFLEQVAKSSEKAFPFIERCGVEVLEVKRGYCHLRMPIQDNQNHIGTMYAGALFTLAELPGGVVYLTCFDMSKMFPLLKGLDINFYRPVTADAEVRIQLDEAEIERISATVMEHGKCDYSWQADITTADGTVVAVADCRYQMRKIGS